ncbi:MAG: hypothetical protein A2Z27_01440 [candidate division Zixibacteria bacterium RBG_16_50_21]|nr:MAG: hypothetical protein A2Z27_01440 [candidate division Zixibacteria bacterium RBG_16_50_21]
MNKILGSAVLTLILVGAGAQGGELHTFSFDKELASPANPVLDISNTSGSIVITSQPSKTIKIQAIKRIKARNQEEAKKIADHIAIDVTVQGSTVKVETEFEDVKSENFWEFLFGRKSGRSAWVEYQVAVPVDCQLAVSATSADIDVRNMKAPVGISCTSGDIQVHNLAGDLEMSVTSGDMILSDIEGMIQIDATSGDLRLEKLVGELVYHSSSGDVQAENIHGDVEIETSSGDVQLEGMAGEVNIEASSSEIMVKQIEGGLSIETTSGDILVSSQKLSGKVYSLESSSGNIEFSMPTKEGGRLELETASGTLRANLPVTVESISERRFSGYINKSGPDIIIRTTSGDVLLTGL